MLSYLCHASIQITIKRMWVSQPAITKLNQVCPPIFALAIGNAQNYPDRYVVIYDVFAFRGQRTTFSQRLCFVMVLRVQIVSDQIRYNLKLKQSYQFLKRDKGVKVRAEWRMLDCKATNRSLLRQFEPIQLSTTQDSKIDVIKEVKFRQFEPIQLHNPWF